MTSLSPCSHQPAAKKVLIAKATVLKDSDDSDESEEVTPQKKKKNAGQQFGHKGCHHED